MEGTPKYTVYRTKRKNIRMVLRANGTLSVYCPKRCSVSEIEAMVSKNYARLSKLHNEKADKLFTDATNRSFSLPYLGKRYPITYGNTKKLCFNGEMFIAKDGCDRETLRCEYVELLRSAAKKALPQLLKSYADAHGFEYSSVRIKSTSSRYGSCSAKKNINLSLALMACDRDFIRFVILHELCHTVHMNHGESFYLLLEKVCPDHKALNNIGKKLYSGITSYINYRPCP